MSRASELVLKTMQGVGSVTECGDDGSCSCACGKKGPATSLDASNAVLDSIDAGYGFEGVEGLYASSHDDDDELDDELEDELDDYAHYESSDSADTFTDDELLALSGLSDDELAALAELEA